MEREENTMSIIDVLLIPGIFICMKLAFKN